MATGLAGTRPGQPGVHPSLPPYGDWTRPSRSGSTAADALQQPPSPVAPATTAIPERDTAGGRRTGSAYDDDLRDDADRDDRGRDFADRDFDDRDDLRTGTGPRRGRYDDDYDDRLDRDEYDDRGTAEDELPRARGPVTGPSTGPSTEVRGGRAAFRAERQAFDAERRKEEKRKGESMSARDYLDGKDEPTAPRGRRRRTMALVFIAVIALGVLGVWSFTSPDTREAATSTPATGSAAAAPTDVTGTTDLPPLVTDAPTVPDAPASPVRVPVTVLNATDTDGLAGRVSSALTAGGWPAGSIGAYSGGDVASTTVFFTEGDENQREAAVQLVDQFPQIIGPTTRFFEVPDEASPGLVVVVAGDWQP